MNDYRYPVSFAEDPDGGISATFPDVPEAITSGSDLPEAMRAASEALGLALRGYLAMNRALPVAQSQGGEMVAPYADDLLKIAFIESFRSSALSAEALGGLAGLKPWQVDALLDPDNVDSVADLENALAVLGRRLRLVVEAA
ncbi:type II toxin-antitoxin system HicB family antitoxin [Aureimonas glaciei]|uniref:Type II toxin-antitoxin system HicB family antitoxin n=1 Tax=Aureimonas glaciei TaxID=1776957 RepID=A0A917D8S9_9HYPH|nr:type II toxin-antitoxin system HicB family antitoxin [Aureimonas glaciei]GGD09184.1 hypothetical protein GCM10011335_10070 [Aureimonas glaciei]